jgi:hypothetical protein
LGILARSRALGGREIRVRGRGAGDGALKTRPLFSRGSGEISIDPVRSAS